MNCLALRDGFRDDCVVGSIVGFAVGKEYMTRRLQIMLWPADKIAEAGSYWACMRSSAI